MSIDEKQLLGDALAINGVAQLAHKTSKSKGFHKKTFNLGEKLALVMTELAEAIEADRAGESKERVVEELADVVIRTFDLSGFYTDRFGEVIINKMKKNLKRPTRHGKKY